MKDGQAFVKQFKDEQVVKNYQLVLDFFAENKLLADARLKQKEFMDWIYGDSGVNEMINDAKEFSGYNKASQEIFIQMQGVIKHK